MALAVAVRAAEPATSALIRTRLDHSQRLMRHTRLLLDHTAMLRTDMITVMRQSAHIVQRSRHLAPRPIRGGADDRAVVTGVLAGGAALCVACIAKQTGIPQVEVPSLIEKARQTSRVETPYSPCLVCGTTRKVYQLHNPGAEHPAY